MGNYGSRLIVGRDGEYDRAGYSVTGIGDFNGDGIGDFAVTARNGENGYYNTAGSVYVVYGTDDADLTFDLNDIDGTNGFEIRSDAGVSDFSYSTVFGSSIVGLGDVNGDGVADFGIVENATQYGYSGYYGEYGGGYYGEYGYGYNSPRTAGVAYVIYGGQDVTDSQVDVDDLDHFRLDADGEITEIVSLGDVNGDTFNDIGVNVSTQYSVQRVNSYYVYDANDNGVYDYDEVTNPDEYQEFRYSRYVTVDDVTGYVVYGTDQERENFDPIADPGGSSVIVDLTNLDAAEGVSIGLGQTLGGGPGFYGEFGEVSAFGAIGPINDQFGYDNYDSGAGIVGGVDINGDGFDDILTQTGSVYVSDSTSYSSGYYTGGVFVDDNAVEIISGEDNADSTGVGVQSFVESGRDQVAGLGNFSGNDAPEELAMVGFARLSDFADAELPRDFTSGVYVVNGRADFFDTSFENFTPTSVSDGDGSFFFSSSTYTSSFNGSEQAVVYNIVGVLGVGDVTGDGIDDLLIATERYDEVNFNHMGIYVVAGTEGARTGAIDLDALVSEGGAYLYMVDGSYDDLVIATAGDVNGDGVDDIIAGNSRDFNGNGSATIIHGGEAAAEAADNADGTDDNIISTNNLIVDVDTGLVPIEVSVDPTTEIVYVTEGTGSPVDATFTLRRTGDLTAEVTVDYTVSSGGLYSFYDDADAQDFEGGLLPSGTATFAAGEDTVEVVVQIAGDSDDEDTEDYSLVLSNPTTDNDAPVRISDDTAFGVIYDNDDPVRFRVYNTSVNEGNPGDDNVLRIQVYRYGNTTVEASIDWTVTGYTPSPSIAAEDDDLEGGLPQSGTLTFAAGETTLYIELPIAEDTDIEGTEYVSVTLSNPVAPDGVETEIVDGDGYGGINNDDFPVQFAVNNPTVTESDGEDVTLTFTITRSGIIDADATVDFRLAANGADADDFSSGYIDPDTGQPREGTLTFAAGETTKTVSVQVAGDDIDENTERLNIHLTNPTTTDTNTPEIVDGFGVGTIFDDDESVEFSVSNAFATEGADGDETPLTFTVFRTGLTDVEATVDFSLEAYVSSAAADADDFASGFPQSGTLTFAAGETQKTVTAVISDDNEVETQEIVQLLLSNPTAVGEEAKIIDANGFGYISNDDIPVRFHSNSVAVNEGDEGETTEMVVRVFRTGEFNVPATLDYTVAPFISSQAADDDDIVGSFDLTGTLNFAAGDTFQDIIIPIQGDNDTETDEFVQVTFSNPTATGAEAILDTGSVTGRITNDDLPVGFSVNFASTTEGANGDETPLTFTITRSGETDVAATVDYELRGYQPSPSIAAESQDFAGGLPQTGTVSFAAGETSKTVTVQVVDDAVFEGTEYVEMILSNPLADTHPQGAVLNNGYGQGIIYDDEIPVYFRVFSDTVTEGDPGETTTLSMLVQRTGDTTVEASVDYKVSTYYYRGATDPDLAESMPLPIIGTVDFAAGETQKYIEIDVAGDDDFEGTEYLQVDLSNPSSGNPDVLPVIITSRAYGYINDDDIPTYFRVYGSTTTEGDTASDNTMMSFVVTRYGDTSAAATVDYDISGGTVDASDFEADEWPTSGTLSFAAGETSKTVLVPIAEDDNVENDEYTYMRLSNATSADAGITAQITTSSASAVIRNDDFPAYLSVTSWTSTNEGDTAADNTELTFTVYRSGDTSSALTVDYAFTADGYTPVDASDFEAGLPQNGTLSFGAGETQKTVTFRVAEDEEIEGNERGRFTISNAQVTSGADDASVQITRSTGYGTIYNDDQPPSITVLVNGSTWGTSVNEGNSGFTDVVLNFVREGDLNGELTVNYDMLTNQGSVRAADSQDIDGFLPAFGLSVDFADGEASATATVRINGDGLIEANESFSIRVTGYDSADDIDYTVINPNTSITIRNDDGRPPIPELPFDVDGDGVIEEGEFIRVEADVFGDPHIITLDGLGYDFQAVGEYVLVESQPDATNPFSVQVRFEAFPGSDLVSVTTRMAVEVKGKTVEVDALNPDAPLLVDGVAVDLTAAATAGIDLDDDTTNSNDIFVDEDGKIFIRLNTLNADTGAGEMVMVGVMDGSLNVCVFLGDPAEGGNAGAVRGLMGNANQDLTDDFQLRDGSEIPEEAISFDDDGVPSLTFDYIYGFGDYEGGGYKGSWSLEEGEALFSGDTPDFPENFPAAPLKLENLPASVVEAAERAAIAAGLDPDAEPVIFENAVLDFALTGMGAFLGGATQLAGNPDTASEATEAPDLAPTVNVTADLSEVTEGDTGVQEVTFTFYRIGGTNGALEVTYEIGGDVDADDLGTDTPLSGTVSFADGEDEQTLTVLVKGDLATELSEALEVSITGTDNEAVLVGAAQGSTTIVTDDFGPEAQDDAGSGTAGGTINGNVLADNGQGEDTDADGDTLSVTSVIVADTEYAVADGTVDLGDGRTLTVGADGEFQFVMGGFYADLLVGEVELFEFSYEVSDGNGGTDTADVTLSVKGNAVPFVNTGPVANDDAMETDEDTAKSINVLDNDEDADDDALLITGATIGGVAVALGVEVALAGLGKVTIQEDGEITYDPAGDLEALGFNPQPEPPAQSFTIAYTISDGTDTDDATLEIGVRGVNDAPDLVAPETVDVVENTTEVATIAATDLEGDDVTFSISGGADGDLFTIDEDTGALSFIAAPDFEAPGDADGDNTYEVEVSASDGRDASTAEVAVVVTDEDEAPVLNEVTGTTGSDRLVGTDEADHMDALGGRMDILTGLGGADVFDFTSSSANGAREVRRITDYSDEDSIVLGNDVGVLMTREVGSNTYIYLDGDRDILILENVSGFDTDSLL